MTSQNISTILSDKYNHLIVIAGVRRGRRLVITENSVEKYKDHLLNGVCDVVILTSSTRTAGVRLEAMRSNHAYIVSNKKIATDTYNLKHNVRVWYNSRRYGRYVRAQSRISEYIFVVIATIMLVIMIHFLRRHLRFL